MRILVILSLLLASACSGPANRTLYNTLQNRNCLERQGIIYCEGSVDYEIYQKQRLELLKKEQPKTPPEKTVPLPGPRAEPSPP
jgi:hypothetical protein